MTVDSNGRLVREIAALTAASGRKAPPLAMQMLSILAIEACLALR
jgi:hypothetical protein